MSYADIFTISFFGTLMLFVVIKVISGCLATELKNVYEKRIKKAIEEYFDILNSKFQKLIKKDSYGSIDYSKWLKELEYFVKNVIFADISLSDEDFKTNVDFAQKYFLEYKENRDAFLKSGKYEDYK